VDGLKRDRPTLPPCSACGSPDVLPSRPRLLDELADSIAALWGLRLRVFRCRYCLRKFRVLVPALAGPDVCPRCGQKLP
jgi:hypothetical protein